MTGRACKFNALVPISAGAKKCNAGEHVQAAELKQQTNEPSPSSRARTSPSCFLCSLQPRGNAFVVWHAAAEQTLLTLDLPQSQMRQPYTFTCLWCWIIEYYMPSHLLWSQRYGKGILNFSNLYCGCWVGRQTLCLTVVYFRSLRQKFLMFTPDELLTNQQNRVQPDKTCEQTV